MMAKSKISLKWSANFAYAVGLLTTDGCLSPDGRHIDLTSKDIEQLKNFKTCLGIKSRVSLKMSGTGSISHRIQFGSVSLYRFLLEIGLIPNKSKTLGLIKLPKEYFFDFLRGHFDGDGSFYSYYDSRWKSSLMFYMCFVSASEKHILWLRKMTNELLGINGSIAHARGVYQLRFAKRESLKLIRCLYYNQRVVCLSRKRRKIEAVLQNMRGW